MVGISFGQIWIQYKEQAFRSLRRPDVVKEITGLNPARNKVVLCLTLTALALCLTLVPHRAYGERGCRYEQVRRVIDGDTIELVNGRRVRLLGIDTPESADPRRPVQWFGLQAKFYLKKLLDKKVVCLRRDRDRTINLDRYNRLLRYVYLDKTFVNREIIREGYGFVFTRYPFQYMDDFRRLQKEAIRTGTGLWNTERYRQWLAGYSKRLALASRCRSDGIVCSWDALKYIGKRKRVRLLIRKVHDAGERIYFNSEDDIYSPLNFTVVLIKGDSREKDKGYDGVELLYWGRIAEVTGYIREKRGRAEMEIGDLKELTIITGHE